MTKKVKVNKIEDVVVYSDNKYFSAWPFNGGFWQFSDGEVAVGFIRGVCDYYNPETLHHNVVDCENGEYVIIRSCDGGISWDKNSMTSVYQRPEFDEMLLKKPITIIPGKSYDPTRDGYCLACGFGITPPGKPATIYTMISTDRGQTWSEPDRLPYHQFYSVGGRPSYVVREDGAVLLFCHGNRSKNGETSSIPIVYYSENGGVSFHLMAEFPLVPAEPMGIMPYPLILDNGNMLAAVRRQYSGWSLYTQIYISEDMGRTWNFHSRVNDLGAPASITQLPDSRVVCVYGYRVKPWGIRARISEDRGKTWSSEIILRDDGGSWDLGYPRTIVRPDGKLLSVYYFNSKNDSIQQNGGVRHIAATIWEV